MLALVVAGGIRRSLARPRIKANAKWVYGVTAFCVLLTAFALNQPQVKEFFSERCGGPSGDDFFYGYYMRKEHVPQQTALNLERYYGKNSVLPPVYMSFSADPWPTMYYLLANGFRSEFLFDGPRGKVGALTSDSIVILSKKENPETVTSRFGVTLDPLFQTPMHSVFKVR